MRLVYKSSIDSLIMTVLPGSERNASIDKARILSVDNRCRVKLLFNDEIACEFDNGMEIRK